MSDKTIGRVRPDGFPAGANDGEVEAARERVEEEAKKVFTDAGVQFFTSPVIDLIEKEMDDFVYYPRWSEKDIERRKGVIAIVLSAINKAGYRVVD